MSAPLQPKNEFSWTGPSIRSIYGSAPELISRTEQINRQKTIYFIFYSQKSSVTHINQPLGHLQHIISHMYMHFNSAFGYLNMALAAFKNRHIIMRVFVPIFELRPRRPLIKLAAIDATMTSAILSCKWPRGSHSILPGLAQGHCWGREKWHGARRCRL
jgi:hypothetical protein